MGLPAIKIRLSLRAKIVALLTVALAVSLLSYLYAGTSLIVEDKTSYIYDYNLAQVRAVSNAVNAQIRKLSTSAAVIAGLLSDNATHPEAIGARTADPDPITLRKIFAQHAKELGLETLLLLKPSTEQEFIRQAFYSTDAADETAQADALQGQLAKLGWTPKTFAERPLLVGSSADGRTIVGGRAQDAKGEPLAFVTSFKIDPAIFQNVGKGFEIRLIDGRGQLLVSKSGNVLTLSGPALAELEANLAKGAYGSFGSGVRDWEIDGRKYMVSYDRIAQDQLLALSYVDRDVAFSAAKALVQRSLVLSLSILLLAIGVTFIFVRGLTSRLKELWQATERVARGDFSLRLDTSKGQNDEISGLAGSFNAMSSKIDELVLQTADKARMEKELETAQAVQSRFFPATDFAHPNLRLAGQYVPASECAGDWWHYRQVGDKLYVVVGDVTGHGVSAALVTAAAHGAFSLIMKSAGGAGPSPEQLVHGLNEAIFAAGGGSTMTFFLSVIDLQTGRMTLANASHCPPYVYAGPGAGKPISRFKPLIANSADALGATPQVTLVTSEFQLAAGQKVFWYTDGIMDQRISDNTKMSKSVLLGLFARISDEKQADSTAICGSILGETLEFFGGAANRPDDITLVVASIPADAQFQGQTAPEAGPPPVAATAPEAAPPALPEVVLTAA